MQPFPIQSNSPISTLLVLLAYLVTTGMTVLAIVIAWRLMRAHEVLAEQHRDLVRALREPSATSSVP